MFKALLWKLFLSNKHFSNQIKSNILRHYKKPMVIFHIQTMPPHQFHCYQQFWLNALKKNLYFHKYLDEFSENMAPALTSHLVCKAAKSIRHVVGVSLLASSAFFSGENSSSRSTSQMAKFLKFKKKNLFQKFSIKSRMRCHASKEDIIQKLLQKIFCFIIKIMSIQFIHALSVLNSHLVLF